MSLSKNIKICIFEDDQSIAHLLQVILNGLGYNNLTIFPDVSMCSLYTSEKCECSSDNVCAEVSIIDVKMPNINGIDFFECQRKRGCKVLHQNTALMSAGLTPRQESLIAELDCKFIQKPFKIADIEKWLSECESRVIAQKQLVDVS